MNDEEIAAIRERAEQATPGPWKAIANEHGWFIDAKGQPFFATLATGSLAGAWPTERIEADQRFIAHARADVPALLAEVERLRNAH